MTTPIVDPTSGRGLNTRSNVMPLTACTQEVDTDGPSPSPHFVPHQAKGRTPYLDERLFVCRAVVMGVEAEPMRMKEKKKQRTRKVKTVKSKHKYTILKIKELRVKSLEEIEGGHSDVSMNV
jgi:large subunit ribosomal protein L21